MFSRITGRFPVQGFLLLPAPGFHAVKARCGQHQPVIHLLPELAVGAGQLVVDIAAPVTLGILFGFQCVDGGLQLFFGLRWQAQAPAFENDPLHRLFDVLPLLRRCGVILFLEKAGQFQAVLTGFQGGQIMQQLADGVGPGYATGGQQGVEGVGQLLARFMTEVVVVQGDVNSGQADALFRPPLQRAGQGGLARTLTAMQAQHPCRPIGRR